jgi:acyl-CoA synthetase (AMP-forming)/AMP-acid ligase II
VSAHFGRAIPGRDIGVVDTNGAFVLTGAEGEMVVRSASNMIGCWNDHEAREQSLKGDWLHTGDLVRQDTVGFL